jgi:hypothetical protein
MEVMLATIKASQATINKASSLLKASKRIINQVRKWVIITSSKDLSLAKVNTLGKASIRVVMVNTHKANILKVNTLKVNIPKASMPRAITEDPDSNTLEAGLPVGLLAVSSEV